MEVQQRTIDGINTFWAHTPGPLKATLTFRVGASDESFPTVGITHLIEHLIYSRMPVLHHEHNGTVGLFATRLTLEGNNDQVVAALAGIGRAICDIAAGKVTNAEIENEVRILQAEASGVVPPSLAEMLDARFGPVGLGLSAVESTYIDRNTPETVSRWASKYFTSGNVVLALSGPPPEGMRLGLPGGPRQERIRQETLQGAGRSEYPSQGDEVVISFEVPPTGHGLECVNGVLSRTLRDRAILALRRSEGLLYDMEYSEVSVGVGGSIVVLQLTMSPKYAFDVARKMLDLIRLLRDGGINAEEQQRLIDDGRNAAADEPDGFEEVESVATSGLLGLPWLDRDALNAAYGSYANADLADFLADFESSLVVGIPITAYVKDPETQDPEAKLLAFRDHRPASGITGTVYRRGTRGMFLKVPRDAKLVIGEAGFDFRAGSDHLAYRFEDVVAGMYSTDRRSVFMVGRDGAITELNAEWFRNGVEALAELESRLRAQDPAKVVLDADEYQLEEEAAS